MPVTSTVPSSAPSEPGSAPRRREDGWLLVAALVVLAVGIVALYRASAEANGTFVFPLDDSYIHLGMARTFAEHGTWGVNPGEFASATSAPLYTALLGASFTFVMDERIALLLNGLAAAGVLWLASELAPNTRARAATLLFVLAAGPLPYLAALGMEHVLHTGLVLALAVTALRPTPHPALLGGIAAAATLTRYETIFVVAPLAALLASERRVRDAAVVIGASIAAIGAYALWSAAMGGLPIPNSIVMKSALAGGWVDLWRDNLYEGGPVLLLALAAAAGTVVGGPRERHLLLFAAAALLHLTFARIGWLSRYEGYLVVWGGSLVVPLLFERALGGSRGRALFAAALLIPCGWRSWEAVRGYVPCSRTIHDNDVVLARMIERVAPDATVAVHNIGALAWLTDATIVDLAGLATTEVTRMHLDHAISGASLGALLARRGVDLGYTDRAWLADDLPTGISEVGMLTYDTPGQPAATRIWVGPNGDADGLRAQIAAALGLVTPDPGREAELVVDPASLSLQGPAVVAEGAEVAFYSSGAATFTAPSPGTLSLQLRGTRAADRGPRVTVVVGERTTELSVGSASEDHDAGEVRGGDTVSVLYEDDLVDAEGNDRNLWIERIVIRPGSG